MAAAVVAEFCFGLLLRHLLYIHAEASIINVCPTTTNPYSAAPNYIFFLLKTKATPRGLILINDVGLPQNQSPMPPDIFLPSPVCMKGILLWFRLSWNVLDSKCYLYSWPSFVTPFVHVEVSVRHTYNMYRIWWSYCACCQMMPVWE